MDTVIKYWGKASPPDTYHRLAYHSLDAMAVAEAWLTLDKALLQSITRSCGVDEAKVKAWVLFFIGLHNLGKWDVRFQLKVETLALSLNCVFEEVAAQDVAPYNHGAAGFAWFQRESDGFGFDAYDDAAMGWMRAVAGHHGSLQMDHEIQNPSASAKVISCDQSARRGWGAVLRKLILEPSGIANGESPPDPPFFIAGFCSVCDWLASNEEFFFPCIIARIFTGGLFEAPCRKRPPCFGEKWCVGRSFQIIRHETRFHR